MHFTFSGNLITRKELCYYRLKSAKRNTFNFRFIQHKQKLILKTLDKVRFLSLFHYLYISQISTNAVSIMAVVLERVTISPDPSPVTAHRNTSWDLTIELAGVSDNSFAVILYF